VSAQSASLVTPTSLMSLSYGQMSQLIGRYVSSKISRGPSTVPYTTLDVTGAGDMAAH
jgi:hypothetical protein